MRQPGCEYRFSCSRGSLPEPLRVLPLTRQPRPPPGTGRGISAMVGCASGSLCGPAEEAHSPSWGVLLAKAPEGRHPSRVVCRPRAGSALHPRSHRGPRPHLPSLCLMLANHSSLFLSSPPTWLPCLPGDIRHPSEHLRSLAFALWPSNSPLSSAAASPQFSATGSTPSHKKADLSGRHLPFVQTTYGVPPGAWQVPGPQRATGDDRQSQNLTPLQSNSVRQRWTPQCHGCGNTEHPSSGARSTPVTHHHSY